MDGYLSLCIYIDIDIYVYLSIYLSIYLYAPQDMGSAMLAAPPDMNAQPVRRERRSLCDSRALAHDSSLVYYIVTYI